MPRQHHISAMLVETTVQIDLRLYLYWFWKLRDALYLVLWFKDENWTHCQVKRPAYKDREEWGEGSGVHSQGSGDRLQAHMLVSFYCIRAGEREEEEWKMVLHWHVGLTRFSFCFWWHVTQNSLQYCLGIIFVPVLKYERCIICGIMVQGWIKTWRHDEGSKVNLFLIQ